MLTDLLKLIVRNILKALYRIEVHGLDNYRKAGDRVLVIANHTSLLDAVILVLFLPGRLAYAINTHVAQRWCVRPFLRFVPQQRCRVVGGQDPDAVTAVQTAPQA